MRHGISMVIAAILSAGCASPALAAGDPCFGAGSTWTFGGIENTTSAVADFIQRTGKCGNGGYCTLMSSDGIAYALSFDGEHHAWTIGMKRRSLAAGEQLPFGIAATDAPAQTLNKIQQAGHRAGYGRTMDAYPATVGLYCGAPGATYLLEFVYSADGHMTGVTQTPSGNGWSYVDDPTKSFMMKDD